MAASSQQILKEYLLSLGFKIDEVSNRKFDLGIGKLDTSALGLAKRFAAAALAAQVMTAMFARSMEKLYYSSVKGESAAGNIKALEFAAEQVGISGDTMRSALEGMSRALRTNPGLQGLIESLGVQVTGRDRADVLVDMVTQLNKMPFYQAAQYASLFGINPDDLLLLEKGIEKLKAARDLRLKMAQDAGLNVDAAAQAGLEYSNILGRLTERVSILKDTLALALLPFFKQSADWFDNILAKATKTVGDANAGKAGGWGGVAERASQYLKKTAEDWWGTRRGAPVASKPSAAAPASAPTDPKSLFSRLEDQFGLPRGLLDKMWAKESSRGKKMLSPAGAKGHFGFMDATAKEMGLDDPNDLTKSAQKAAEYMAKLLKRYGGDMQKALAAYNWGMGNVDRKGMGALPWETQDYVTTISGRPVSMTQTNHFHISAADPTATAAAVGARVDTTWSDLTRNAEGAVR